MHNDFIDFKEELLGRALIGASIGQADLIQLCSLVEVEIGQCMLLAQINGDIIPGMCCFSNEGDFSTATSRKAIEEQISQFDPQHWSLVKLDALRSVHLSIYLPEDIVHDFRHSELFKIVSECFILIASRSLVIRNVFLDSDRGKGREVRRVARKLARDAHFDLKNIANIALEAILAQLPEIDVLAAYKLNYRFSEVLEIRANGNGVDFEAHEFRLACQGCIKSKNPTEFKVGDKFYILIPMSPDVENSLFYNCVVLLPNHSLLQASVVSSFQSLLEQFSTAYIGEAKSLCLHQLHLKLKQSFPPSPSEYEWPFIRKQLHSVFFEFGKFAVPLTNSHSFTFRLSVEKAARLEPFVEFCSNEGGRNVDFDKAVISKFDTSQSCNAFTFAFCNQEEGYIYVPDLQAIPEKYVSRGLTDVKFWRKSRSEVTIPFYFKDTKIGVVNFESPQPRNYDTHVGFLLEATSMVSRYLETLMSRFDTLWVGELTKSRAALHEARQLVLQELVPDVPGPLDALNRQNVSKLGQMLDSALTTQPEEAQVSLAHTITSIISDLRDGLSCESKHVVVNVQEAGVLAVHKNPHLHFVLREVITNFAKSLDGRNRLKISFFDQENVGQDVAAVVIETTFYDFVGQTEAKQLALQPLTYDGRRHYGTYLCAALARTVGGWVSVEGDPMVKPYMHLTYRVPVF